MTTESEGTKSDCPVRRASVRKDINSSGQTWRFKSAIQVPIQLTESSTNRHLALTIILTGGWGQGSQILDSELPFLPVTITTYNKIL